MMKQTNTNSIHQDLNAEFERHINLYNLIGQYQACKILLTVIDEHCWNTIEQTKHPIKPILIYGKCSCGTLARAISNTIGNVEFTDVAGQFVGYGIGLNDHFQRFDEHTTYYISDFDHMAYYFKQPLHTLVKNSIINIPEIHGFQEAQRKFFSGLLILSSGDESKLTKTMERNCEAVIHIKDYSTVDIGRILEQRIALYGLVIEQQTILIKSIVDVVNCDVQRCIELLHWSYKCCRATGDNIITIKHLNKALHLMR